MRIGFLISGTLDAVTGGYIYDQQLVKFLQKSGHEVQIINFRGHNYFSRLFHGFGLVFSEKLTHLEIDILIQDELDHPALAIFNRYLKRHTNFPIVSVVHHLYCSESRPIWQNRILSSLEKLYLRGVDGCIFNSRATRESVEKLVSYSQPGVLAYPSGDRLKCNITEREIRERAQKPGPLRIVFLGNLIKRKALHVLLDALSASPQDNFHLTVIGDPSIELPYFKTIIQKIRNKNIESLVSFLGKISDVELEKRLRESHVLAVPSSYEGFGIAYLEGMGFGLPAIGTYAGGASEIITNNYNGFLVQPEDYTSIANHFEELNENRVKLASMGVNALNSFNSHPTWQTSGNIILNFIKSLVA